MQQEHASYIASFQDGHEEKFKAAVHHLTTAHEKAMADLRANFEEKLSNQTFAAVDREKELSSEVNGLQVQIQIKKQAAEFLQVQVDRQEQLIVALEQQKSALELNCEGVQARLYSEQEAHEADCREAQSSIAELKQKLEMVQAHSTSKEQSIMILIEQKVALENQLSAAQSQVGKAEGDLIEKSSGLQMSLRELQQKHDKLAVLLRVREQELEKSLADQVRHIALKMLHELTRSPARN